MLLFNLHIWHSNLRIHFRIQFIEILHDPERIEYETIWINY